MRRLLYALLVPVGVVLRLVRDPMGTRRPAAGSTWRPVRSAPPSIEEARRSG